MRERLIKARVLAWKEFHDTRVHGVWITCNHGERSFARSRVNSIYIYRRYSVISRHRSPLSDQIFDPSSHASPFPFVIPFQPFAAVFSADFSRNPQQRRNDRELSPTFPIKKLTTKKNAYVSSLDLDSLPPSHPLSLSFLFSFSPLSRRFSLETQTSSFLARTFLQGRVIKPLSSGDYWHIGGRKLRCRTQQTIR